jgi:hypothetical protein
MPTPKKISLAAVIAPAFGIVLDAPPVLDGTGVVLKVLVQPLA